MSRKLKAYLQPPVGIEKSELAQDILGKLQTNLQAILGQDFQADTFVGLNGEVFFYVNLTPTGVDRLCGEVEERARLGLRVRYAGLTVSLEPVEAGE